MLLGSEKRPEKAAASYAVVLRKQDDRPRSALTNIGSSLEEVRNGIADQWSP